MVADGDDQFALRHDGVVGAFEGEVFAVDAVISGEEWGVGALSRPPGRPGGGAGAGVDDGNAFGEDQIGQAGGVAADFEGVFGIERERDHGGAGAADLGRERAAGACHDGAAAGAGDGLGDFERATFHAAGAEGGEDLEDGDAVKGSGLVLHRHRVLSRVVTMDRGMR